MGRSFMAAALQNPRVFRSTRDAELYVASQFKGDGASHSAGDRAGFLNRKRRVWRLMEFPGNKFSVRGLLDAHREIAGHLHLTNMGLASSPIKALALCRPSARKALHWSAEKRLSSRLIFIHELSPTRAIN